MRISKKGEYALRAMSYLAMNYGDGTVRIGEIASRERIPKKFLQQILLLLRKAGILRSERGVEGGYALAKEPGKITLAEVIRIVDGPLAPMGCASTWAHVSCPEEKSCQLRRVMLVVRNAVAGILEGITFEEMSGRELGKTSSRSKTRRKKEEK